MNTAANVPRNSERYPMLPRYASSGTAMNVTADSVVATIDTASAHVGSDRPARKYSCALCLPPRDREPDRDHQREVPAEHDPVGGAERGEGRGAGISVGHGTSVSATKGTKDHPPSPGTPGEGGGEGDFENQVLG